MIFSDDKYNNLVVCEFNSAFESINCEHLISINGSPPQKKRKKERKEKKRKEGEEKKR